MKRGKTRVTKSLLIFIWLLIGWKMAPVLQENAEKNQCYFKCLLKSLPNFCFSFQVNYNLKCEPREVKMKGEWVCRLSRWTVWNIAPGSLGTMLLYLIRLVTCTQSEILTQMQGKARLWDSFWTNFLRIMLFLWPHRSWQAESRVRVKNEENSSWGRSAWSWRVTIVSISWLDNEAPAIFS